MTQSHHKRSSVRRRTLVTLIATIVILVLVLGVVSRLVLDAGFVRLEQRYAQQEMERIRSIFIEQCERLDVKTADWAQWDGMYRFMQQPTDAFRDANLTGINLRNLQVDVLLLHDMEGNYKHGAAYDHSEQRIIHVDPAIRALLQPDHVLLKPLDDYSPQQQIVRLENKALLLSSRPVLTSAGNGPPRGTLILGHWLDSDWLTKLSGIANRALEISWRDETQFNRRVQEELDVNDGISLFQKSENILNGYVSIETNDNEYPLIITVPLDRDIIQQGHHTFILLIIVIFCAGMVLTLVVLLSLDRTVLSRLERLSNRVAEISQTNDPVGVIDDTALDELGHLGEEVNRLLATQRGWREQIMTRNASMSLIFDALPIGLLTLDANNRVQSERSSATTDLLGRIHIDDTDFGEIIAPGADGAMTRRRLLDFLQLVRAGNLSTEELDQINPVKTAVIDRSDGRAVVRCRFYRIDEMNSTTRRIRKQDTSKKLATQILVTITDITDEQRLEAEVARSHAEFQQLKAMAEDVDLFNTFINIGRSSISDMGTQISMLGDQSDKIRLQDLQRATQMLLQGGEIFGLSALLQAAQKFNNDLVSFVGMTHISETEVRRCRYGVADLEGAINQIERQFRTLLGMGSEDKVVRPTGLIRQSFPEVTPEELRSQKRLLLAKIASNKLILARVGLAPIIRSVPMMARRRNLDVNFTMVGEETPIEQQTVDVISHVLPHILRFTMDNGLDNVEDRVSANKPEQVTLTLSCERQARALIITLVDDGHGIDHNVMRRMAIEQNVLSAEEASALSDHAAQELVFKVLHNSGDESNSGVHYVGLNLIVQRLQDDLSADITVKSTVGQGTAIIITVPL